MRALLLTGVVLLGCGSAAPLECPPNAVERTTCTQCGPDDGCQRSERICAPVCSVAADCTGAARTCLNGACVPFPCG